MSPERSRRILVIEDDRGIGPMLVDLLVSEGYRADLATTIREAISRYSASVDPQAPDPYDGTVLDGHVPDDLPSRSPLRTDLRVIRGSHHESAQLIMAHATAIHMLGRTGILGFSANAGDAMQRTYVLLPGDSRPFESLTKPADSDDFLASIDRISS